MQTLCVRMLQEKYVIPRLDLENQRTRLHRESEPQIVSGRPESLDRSPEEMVAADPIFVE